MSGPIEDVPSSVAIADQPDIASTAHFGRMDKINGDVSKEA